MEGQIVGVLFSYVVSVDQDDQNVNVNK